MIESLIHAAVAVAQVLFVWTILAVLVAMVWAGYARNRARQQRREQETLSAAWARYHGGDPEYQGGLGQKAPPLEVVQPGGETRVRLLTTVALVLMSGVLSALIAGRVS